MFQNLKTNWPNTHAKFEPDWFSGFLKKLSRGIHGFVDLLLGFYDESEQFFREMNALKPLFLSFVKMNLDLCIFLLFFIKFREIVLQYNCLFCRKS